MKFEELGLILLEGSHERLSQGACVLEAVAYIAGEEWSDHPECACPVIAAFARRLNDRMTNEERVALVPLIPRLAGSRGDRAAEERRMHQVLPLLIAADAADAAYAAAADAADAARLAARKHFVGSAVGMLRKLLDDVDPIVLDDAAWARARELANINAETLR